MEEDDLDVSWIKEQERLQSTTILQKREPMQKINLCFIYIDRNRFIHHISKDIEPVEYSKISNERILHIIQNKKVRTPTSKFKLNEILLYSVNIEPEAIQSFTQDNSLTSLNSSASSFLKSISVANDVKIPESIFIFHNVNMLYFIFNEVEVRQANKNSTLKSILKQPVASAPVPGSASGTGSGFGSRQSKKVRTNITNQSSRKKMP
jgi:hypothetical protein